MGHKLFLRHAVLAVFLACACTPAVAQQQQQPTPRSRDTRGNETRVAHLRCLSQTTAAYAHYEGPQSAREAGEAAYLLSCVADMMPIDWLNAPDYRRQAQTFAETARRSDPRIDTCLLTGCAPQQR